MKNELSDIVKQIKEEGGLELYQHTAHRTDLNDTNLEEPFAAEYVRARYNLTNKIRQISDIHSIVSNTINKVPGGMMNNSFPDFDVVIYGLLPEVIYEEPKTITQQKKGLLGKLGFKEEITTKWNTYYKEKQPLNNVINTIKSDNAYFLNLTIRNEVQDAAGRKGTIPTLTIIATKELTEKVINFLEKNPKDYMDFIKTVLPEDKYPNVNKGIIKDAKPGNAIVFLDVDANGYKTDCDIKKGNFTGLDNWVYEKYGKKVEISN